MAGKTYSGTYTSTILLTSASTQNPATLTGSISVHGTNAASDSGFYSNANVAWSITNLGSISASGATSYGICLLHGGTISNGAAGNTLGIIQSDETGILLTGAAGSVTNAGTIIGTAGRGVFLQDGGTLTNGAGASTATIKGGFVGVAIYNANGSLTNGGTIIDTGSAGLGVELYAGSVSNLAGGQITGVYGVGFVGQVATGTLTNAGTIVGNARDGVELSAGGGVTNSGSIGGAIAGVLALYGTASITNSGTITGGYAGLDLLAGGSVTNQAGGRIVGGFGVSLGNGTLTAPTGTVINQGIITGISTEGVSLAAGGGVNNSGSIYGYAGGVVAFYGAGTITNTGSIGASFIGVELATGGTITNAAGATIAGSYGIVLANGTLTAQARAGSALINSGSIGGSGRFGAELLTDAQVVNQAGATITGGRYGVYMQSVTGSIANYGVISGQVGVYGRAVVAHGTRYAGQLTILNAGTIIGTAGQSVSLFSSNDLLIVRPGAVFTGGVVGGGGRLELQAGGSGLLGTLAGALAAFSTITVDAGASWNAGGTVAATGTLIDLGTMAASGGAIFVNKGLIESQGSGVGTLGTNHNGTLSSYGTIAANIRVVFQDSFGHLSLANPLGDLAPSVGFAAGDTIYLPNIALSGLSAAYVGGAGGGTLALSQAGAVVADLLFAGSYTLGSFALGTDTHGGTDVTIPCFVAGTRIEVAEGTRRVERLRAGDQVLTAGGALREIVWVGQRAMDVLTHADPDSVRPVRIARDAFGAGRPRRDLLLSPDHAVAFAGVLIPVQLLVNGRSVRREAVAHVRYHHLELACHDLLLAEGLEVESYLDTGNLALLGLAGAEHRPQGARCAPLALGGRQVAAARRHLAVQAGRRGGDAAAEATLEAGGHVLAPARRRGGRLLFVLPADTQAVRLRLAAGWELTGLILDGALLPSPGVGLMAARAPRAPIRLPGPHGRPRSLEVALKADQARRQA